MVALVKINVPGKLSNRFDGSEVDNVVFIVPAVSGDLLIRSSPPSSVYLELVLISSWIEELDEAVTWWLSGAESGSEWLL